MYVAPNPLFLTQYVLSCKTEDLERRRFFLKRQSLYAEPRNRIQRGHLCQRRHVGNKLAMICALTFFADSHVLFLPVCTSGASTTVMIVIMVIYHVSCTSSSLYIHHPAAYPVGGRRGLEYVLGSIGHEKHSWKYGAASSPSCCDALQNSGLAEVSF